MHPRRLDLLAAVLSLGCWAPLPPEPPPARAVPAPIAAEPDCVPEDVFASLPAEDVQEIYDELSTPTARGLYDDDDPYDPEDPRAAARHFYEVGRRADAEKRWEDARRAFLESWSLVKNPYIAFALAKTAMSLGKPSEAMHHVAFVLRSRVLPEALRAEATRWHTEAAAQIAWLEVHAEPGACVTFDGLTVGPTPLASSVVVDPGKHHVEVRHQGKRARDEVTTSRAAVSRVTLKLE